jgi:hypothetical protein
MPAKLKDLITMLDFFDPELGVSVIVNDEQPARLITRVKLSQDESQVLLYTEEIT